MAIVLTDDKHYKDIADVIRNEAVAHGAKFKPESMAAEIKGACDYKYYEGHLAGDAEGFERGKQDGDLKIYNMLSNYGTRTNWLNAFREEDFSDYTFPTTFKPIDITQIFYGYAGKSLPKNIVFSSAVCPNNIYNACFRTATKLLELDFSEAPAPSQYSYTFYQCSSLKRLIINANENTDFTYWLTSCSALEELTINGLIGKNVGFGDCSSLNKKSIQNIIRALSPSISGRTVTLKSSAVTNAFGSTSSQEWLDLIAERKNWTINLAS